MNLQDISPEELIKSSWLKTYESEIKILWNQIVLLNTNIFILDKIFSFPFKLFLPLTSESLFWQIATRSILESCILIIFKIAIDEDRKSLTIKKFKNKIRENLKSKQYQNLMDIELNTLNYDKSIQLIVKRLKNLRNKFIAHLDRDWNRKISIEELNKTALNFSELIKIKDEIFQLFDFLCFAEKRSINFIEYCSVNNDIPDIEVILDREAKESDLLNMPEKQKDYFWNYHRKNLSEEDIETLNKYRRKFGLPVV